MTKKRVGILGARSLTAQAAFYLFSKQADFEITAVSSLSQGGKFDDVVKWHLPLEKPPSVSKLQVMSGNDPSGFKECDIILSFLGFSEAQEIEPLFLNAGFTVVSKAAAFRLKEDVPLVLPEINPDSISAEVFDRQQKRYGWSGKLVTTPNCTTSIGALPTQLVEKLYGIQSMTLFSMQSISGSGSHGLSPLEIGHNAIPHIPYEEESVVSEFGSLFDKRFPVSAFCNRVDTHYGHLLRLGFKTARKPGAPLDMIREFEKIKYKDNMGLYRIHREATRPQPLFDSGQGDLMRIHIGNIETVDANFDLKMTVMGHNLFRGGAGEVLLSARLLVEKGLL